MSVQTRVPSMRWVLATMALTTLLAGCADPGPATFRFAGQLDRDLTEAEQAEVRAVTGKDFSVESTDVFCPPEVDPYDCNDTWLRVDGLTEGRCEKAVATLDGRTYWRGAPACDEPPTG